MGNTFLLLRVQRMNQPQYRIVEIFETLQGEGYNTGMPSIFIRFGKCNLACHWCDTNYNQFGMMTLDAILAHIKNYTAPNIIITGGEPTIQPNLEILLHHLKSLGYFIAIETNGLKPVPAQIDYIATSPKQLYANAYEKHCIKRANEVRIVVDDPETTLIFCQTIAKKIHADHYYLSACEQNGIMNILHTITLLGKLNAQGSTHWQLNLQTHKLAGIA